MSTTQAPPVSINIALQRVADYARLSEDDAKDPDLRGENVGIQLDECAVFRTTRPDWTLVGSFKDNDISASAYGNEVRDDFERLMNLVRTNGVDVILCVEVTRLFRKPLEAEVLIDLVWSKKTTFHTVVTTRGGYYDLRTSAGRKAVRDAVNAAAGESDNDRCPVALVDLVLDAAEPDPFEVAVPHGCAGDFEVELDCARAVFLDDLELSVIEVSGKGERRCRCEAVERNGRGFDHQASQIAARRSEAHGMHLALEPHRPLGRRLMPTGRLELEAELHHAEAAAPGHRLEFQPSRVVCGADVHPDLVHDRLSVVAANIPGSVRRWCGSSE